MTELVNVVGGGDLKIGIKLEKVYRNLSAPVLRYDPESFAGLYMKFGEDSPTIMLFSSGKYNIAGADSAESLRDANKQLLSSLTDLGIEIDENEIEVEIRNRVYVDDCGHELDLEMLLPDLGLENTEYDPESFPGIMYRPEEGGLLVLFRSGNMMITGLKDPEKVTQILERMKNRINDLF